MNLYKMYILIVYLFLYNSTNSIVQYAEYPLIFLLKPLDFGIM